MKVSISLSAEDMEFLDGYAREHNSSRSAAVHDAIDSLRTAALADDYAAAFEEWDRSGDRSSWDGVVGDGLK